MGKTNRYLAQPNRVHQSATLSIEPLCHHFCPKTQFCSLPHGSDKVHKAQFCISLVENWTFPSYFLALLLPSTQTKRTWSKASILIMACAQNDLAIMTDSQSFPTSSLRFISRTLKMLARNGGNAFPSKFLSSLVFLLFNPQS